MEQYLSGSSLIERYNILPFQFSALLAKGAVPLSPFTGEALPCLTELESWLHDLSAIVLEAAGRLLILEGTSPATFDYAKISKNSFIILASYSLAKLLEREVQPGVLSENQLQAKKVSPPKAGLSVKKSPAQNSPSSFFYTKALIASASGNEKIWLLLQKIEDSNGSVLKSDEQSCRKILTASYGKYLPPFFVEHASGQIEHPSLRKLLSGFTPFIPKLQIVAQHYWEMFPPSATSPNLKSLSVDLSSWATSASMLGNWDDASNLYRLRILIDILKDLRQNFAQTYLPWENPIKVTRLEEFWETLQSAVFERESIEKICGELFENPLKISDAIEEPSYRSTGVEGPAEEVKNSGNQSMGEKPSPLETIAPAEIISQPEMPPQAEVLPEPEVPAAITTPAGLESPAHWASIYRAHKDLSIDPTEKDAWEMMALRLEGLTGSAIYKKIYPHKAKQTPTGTAKAHVSRTISKKGLPLLLAAALPILPQLQPGKKGKM